MILITRHHHPAAAEGTLVKAKESVPPADKLETENVSDALEFLEIPGDVAAATKATEAEAAKAKSKPNEKPKGAEKGAEGKTPQNDAKPPEKADATPEAEGKKPEFTADQEAWLKLRGEAKTEEEIADLEKEIPEFTPEQAEWINAEAEKAEQEAEPEAAPEEGKAPEFSEEQKPFVEKLQTELKTAQEELAARSKRLEEAEGQLQQLQKQPPPVAGNLHPIFLSDNPQDIEHFETQLEEFIAWGRANWDGSEAVPAQDGKPAQPAYTAQQIRDRVTHYEKQLRKLVPAARQAQASRQAQDGLALKDYPALSDPKSTESSIVEATLKAWPYLRAMPNVKLIICDAIAGEKARMAPAGAGANGKPKLQAFRVKPKGPVRASASAAPRSPGITRPKAEPSAERFRQVKAGEENEVDALAAVLGDG